MKRAFLALLMAFSIGGSAGASDVAVYVIPQPDAPVSITTCTLEKQAVELARGVYVHGVNFGVEFKNESGKSAVAVMFQFTMSDSFGTVLDTRLRESLGTFSPGVVVGNIHWLEVDSWPTLGEMGCSVQRVRFQDGTIWTSEPG